MIKNSICFFIEESNSIFLQSGKITHIYGPPKSGKSTLSAQIALELAKANHKTLIISTERPIEIRMDTMIQADEEYSKDLLEHIMTTDIFSFNNLIQAITNELGTYLDNIDLIIIDSLTSAYRFKAGPISLTLLRRMLSVLQSIAITRNIAIMFTNQVSSKMDETNLFRPVASATTRSYSDITLRLSKTHQHETEITFEDIMGSEIEVLPRTKITAVGFEDFRFLFTLKSTNSIQIAY